MPETSAIAVRGLTHAYGTGKVRQEVLSGIDLEVHAGEVVILTGPSGSGKTTLLTLIGGLRTIETGSATSATRIGLTVRI
jgi:putative ABC transport system ATP-binding protein